MHHTCSASTLSAGGTPATLSTTALQASSRHDLECWSRPFCEAWGRFQTTNLLMLGLHHGSCGNLETAGLQPLFESWRLLLTDVCAWAGQHTACVVLCWAPGALLSQGTLDNSGLTPRVC